MSLRRYLGWGLVLVATTGLLLHALQYDFVSDDAFIYARYARNFVRGDGLVFNVGDRVEAYASLVWVLSIAALGRLGVDYVFAMRTLSLCCALALPGLLYFLCRRRLDVPAPFGIIGAMLLALYGPLACWATGGLETCGYALAILAAVAACPTGTTASARRSIGSGIANALCSLMRPEGLLVPCAIVLMRLRHRRHVMRVLSCELGPSLLALCGVLGFRRAYYGEWVPNTAFAKIALGPALWLPGLRYAWAFAEDYGGSVTWLCVIAAAFGLARSETTRIAAAAATAIVVTTIAEGGDGLPMFRFFVAIYPLLVLMACDLAWQAWSGAQSMASAWQRGAARAIVVCASSAAAIAAFDPPMTLGQYSLFVDQRDREIPTWRAVGRWLAETTPRDASVACAPIGAVGYYSDRFVYDMLGLTDRHIARVPADPMIDWRGHAKHDGPYVLSRRPTILLLGNVDVQSAPLPLSHPFFARPPVESIRQREDDFFTPELEQHYERSVAQIGEGMYLHYFVLRGMGGAKQR